MIDIAIPSKNAMTYEEAVLYCQFLKHKGFTDWRFPTYEEYLTYPKIADCWYEGLIVPVWKLSSNNDYRTWVVAVRDV
jgi:hypothetical protein